MKISRKEGMRRGRRWRRGAEKMMLGPHEIHESLGMKKRVIK